MKQHSPEYETLAKLRAKKHKHLKIESEKQTMGSRVADAVVAVVGSWRFIIIQSVLLGLWLCANIFGWVTPWDPYPFILLNLMLSFQAAYTAPIIMMAQNREAEIDRMKAQLDYDVNLKAELEIELLHEKIDMMREQEIARLTKLVEELSEALAKTNAKTKQ